MVDIFLSGGPVMYPLLLCSLVSVTVIIERTIFWIQVGMRRNYELVGETLDLCKEGDWEGVRQKVSGSRNYVIRVLVSGILHREYSLVKAMEQAGAEEIKGMNRYMGILDTIISVAPLLGIFGTVLGIISSFDMLGSVGLDDPVAVTGGIAQALITTAAGLAIAIFTIFPYNYFNARVERAILNIEKYATSLEILFERLQGRCEDNGEDQP